MVSAPNSTQLDESIEAFLKWGQPKWRPKTTEAYATALRKKLLPWAEGRVWLIDQLDSAALSEFDSYLRSQSIAEASRKTYERHVNGFLTWSRDHVGGHDIKVQISKSKHVERDVLSAKEMRALEAAAHTERDRLVIRLMCDTGMRLGEVVNLKVEDVVHDGGAYYVRARGKTGERRVMIGQGLYARLRAYTTVHRPTPSADSLFVSSRQKNGRYEGLAEKAIYGIIKDAHALTKSTKRCHPHLLRHSNITARCEAGHNLALISQETGASIAVLAEHYSHPSLQARWDATVALFGND